MILSHLAKLIEKARIVQRPSSGIKLIIKQHNYTPATGCNGQVQRDSCYLMFFFSCFRVEPACLPLSADSAW